MELHTQTIHALHEKLRAGEVTSRQITEAVLRRIEAVEPTLRAYIRVLKDDALAQADAIDDLLKKGDIEPTYLTGIPLAVKDVICTKGVTTTCGSKILENFVPQYDATVMEKLRAHHPVLLGKTSLKELFSSGKASLTGTVNPFELLQGMTTKFSPNFEIMPGTQGTVKTRP